MLKFKTHHFTNTITDKKESFNAITINVKHILTLNELATVFVANVLWANDEIIQTTESMTNKEIHNCIKEELTLNGLEHSQYLVSTKDELEIIVEGIERIFNIRFVASYTK